MSEEEREALRIVAEILLKLVKHEHLKLRAINDLGNARQFETDFLRLLGLTSILNFNKNKSE